MNKTILDLENGMPLDTNVDDLLSLGYFRTTLNLNFITHKSDVIKREFEKHDQFCLAVGKAVLVNAFKSFIMKFPEFVIRGAEGTKKLILKFLDETDIKYFYDIDNYDEKKPFDDALSACRSYAGRTVMSLVADSVVHESDGLGCRAVRTAMIPYFLNKKLAQTSKYAACFAFKQDLLLRSQ